VLVGQDAKNIGAILVPNLERLAADTNKAILAETGETIEDPDARKAVRAEIDRLVSPEAGFRPYERPVRFSLLRRPFDVAGGTMTATLKLKRRVITERHEKLIAKLLAD
jgi:long-chain acyl-CoA synthetase